MVLNVLAVVICGAILLLVLPPIRAKINGAIDATFPWRAHLSAENRARGLMREVLTTSEYQQLTRFGYIEIASPTIPHRMYRVPGSGGLVTVFDHNSVVMELCLQPIEPLPDGDVVVMHKLFIETSEYEYLQRANRFAPGILTMRYHY